MKSPKLSQLSPLERAVLLTIAYTDQFEYPLSVVEVLARCVIAEKIPRKVSQRDVDKSVKNLVDRDLLKVSIEPVSRRQFVFLKGRRSIVERRLEREQWASQRVGELEKVRRFCQMLSWVEAIFVTGSLAMHSVDPEDDTDFMLITQPRRLWLTRVLVSLFAQLHGKRRSWNHEEPASWCFNLWLDSEHLAVIEEARDMYRAYEVLQAKLIWERGLVGRQFFKENNWINQFFIQTKQESRGESENIDNQRIPVWSNFLDGVDWLAWKLQHWYMKRHQTKEKVGRGFAFFHPRDTKQILLQGWQRSLERCLSKLTAAEILESYVKHTASFRNSTTD